MTDPWHWNSNFRGWSCSCIRSQKCADFHLNLFLTEIEISSKTGWSCLSRSEDESSNLDLSLLDSFLCYFLWLGCFLERRLELQRGLAASWPSCPCLQLDSYSHFDTSGEAAAGYQHIGFNSILYGCCGPCSSFCSASFLSYSRWYFQGCLSYSLLESTYSSIDCSCACQCPCWCFTFLKPPIPFKT